MAKEIYGIDLSAVKWKPDSDNTIMERFLSHDDNKKAFEEWLSEDDGIQDDSIGRSYFVDEYENETYLWADIEGMITDLINREKCNDVVFHYEDYILGVYATLPANKDDKIISQAEIAEILAEYLNPLIEEPVSIQWYDIRE